MNLTDLIPLALEAGQDALALTKAIGDKSKDEEIAAVLATLPLIAKITGKPLETLQEYVTAESLSNAYDLVAAGSKIAAAVEAAIAKKAG